jgi:signal transduction histidine kinase
LRSGGEADGPPPPQSTPAFKRDTTLATLSHELRTPLTAIVGWSQMLLNGDVERREQWTAFEAIRSSAKAQAHLIDDVLDISRITSGKMRLEREPAGLAAIVEAAVATVRPAAEAQAHASAAHPRCEK